MNSNLKIILIFTAILAIILVVMCYPVFLASYDDVKYVDGKVYEPVDGKYDFETFSLNCSNTTTYKAKVENSGNRPVSLYEIRRQAACFRPQSHRGSVHLLSVYHIMIRFAYGKP